MASNFEGQTLRKIYTELYMKDYSDMWNQIANKVGSKASYCRFYYMDCYTRSAFKDNMKLHNKVVDSFVLEKI